MPEMRWSSGTRQIVSWTTPPGAREIDVILQSDTFQSWRLVFGYPQDRFSYDYMVEVAVPRALDPGKYFVHLHEVMSGANTDGEILASSEVFIDQDPPADHQCLIGADSSP
jgi:hypothetical protein